MHVYYDGAEGPVGVPWSEDNAVVSVLSFCLYVDTRESQGSQAFQQAF